MRRVDMTTALAWQAIFGALCLGAGWLAASAPAIAQQPAPPDWPTEKCNRYKAAYELILKRQGKAGLVASADGYMGGTLKCSGLKIPFYQVAVQAIGP